ncbi:MAG TPA: trypsin-like peptidase domain-containing protein [Nocardioidaceae bacterium]|nr:trypsin-like peptidase domain-containing protein [Nocardioidaceae bacterium]
MSHDEHTTSDNHGPDGPEPTSSPAGWPAEASDPPTPHDDATTVDGSGAHRPRRALGLAAAAVAGTLIVGGAGAGIGIAWDNSRTAGTDTTAASGELGPTARSPFGNAVIPPGSGGSIFGGLPGNALRDGLGTSATLKNATTGQLTGLVRIVSTVDFGAGKAMGTGLVLSSDGEVVTNHHVVAGATAIRVTVASTGQTYTATVVGADAKDDVAVLQLQNATGLQTAPLATSAAHVGDAVTAVGDADGRHRLSAVSGTVTALRQAITTRSDETTSGERLKGMIEIDADVISGDSGGATLNSAGQVVGMTTAASSGSANVTGYAIPIAKVVRIADAIATGQDTARIELGYPAFLGVQLSGQSTEIVGAVRGSGAAEAGIGRRDTVTAVDGAAVRNGQQLRAAIAAHQPGDTVAITWRDASGASHTATVTLGAGPVE